MSISEKVKSEFFNLEVGLAWLAFGEEFGNTPEEKARLDKAKWRKAEMLFDEVQKELKIPAGDPFTVTKAIGDYLTKIGYAKVEVQKLADDVVRYNGVDMIMIEMARYLNSQGIKVYPQPSNSLFITALRKLCNVDAVDIPLSPEDRAKLPKNMYQRTWRLVPLS